MRREPSLTFHGALEILGHREHPVIERLDKLLGGVILAAGAGAGVATLGPPVLAPLGIFAATWGWLEQRDEAVRLLRKAIDTLSNKLTKENTYERGQQIAAAHTTIVVAAYFEALKEQIQVSITDEEQQIAIAGRTRYAGESFYDFLYGVEIPAPSSARGFEENCSLITDWLLGCADRSREFLSAAALKEAAYIRWAMVTKSALERYRSHYLELAAAVPEFMIWATLGEHAATRALIGRLQTDITTALGASQDTLNRLETVLGIATASSAESSSTVPELRVTLARSNGGLLEETIIPEDAQTYGSTLTFPTVREIYINPHYRIARCDASFQNMRPTDEQWWADRPVYDDFDLMLAGHVTSPDATRIPMLLLGHPGAGKSVLTKVLAARLPPSGYTVIRVPLRRVNAQAPLIQQIQQALDLATNGRVEWWRLANQSRDTIRVVLLDGLDELLQATKHDRSGYLNEVAEFQRREAEQRLPAVVIITSRTVVADRVAVPTNTTIVKLESFNDSDIVDWMSRWHRANAAAIAAGNVRELTVKATRRQPELAAQPLLLLMLAVYESDPDLPSLDGDLSTAELYQRILEGFARREAVKDLNQVHHNGHLDELTREHLDRLAITALAMFNRGRQDIDEESLGRDLAVFEQLPPTGIRAAETGQRIIGEFFFVHAPEARTPTGLILPETASGAVQHEHSQRAYEFLHATFGEYLVARRLMDELTEMTKSALARWRHPIAPEDDRLYAMLSHQPLAARQAIIDFAVQIQDELSIAEARHLREVLERLFGGYRSRHDSGRYAAYQPMPQDQVRELACYSANLVGLRTALEPDLGVVPLENLLRTPENAIEQWRSTVRLWQSGLDTGEIQAMLTMVELVDKPLAISYSSKFPMKGQAGTEIALARLVSDQGTESMLRYGAAIAANFSYQLDDDRWHEAMSSMLIAKITGRGQEFIPIPPPTETSDEEIADIAELIFCCLRSELSDPKDDEELTRFIFDLPPCFSLNELSLTSAVLSHADLPSKVPELRRSAPYGRYAGIVRKIRSTVLPRSIELDSPSKDTAVAVRQILSRETINKSDPDKGRSGPSDSLIYGLPGRELKAGSTDTTGLSALNTFIENGKLARTTANFGFAVTPSGGG
jgi:hypothetical protein